MNSDRSPSCVLLTGATGFLGAQIARRLLREAETSIIALVRSENQAAAARRLARSWDDWPELRSNPRVTCLCGDVTRPHLGLDEAAYLRLAGSITHIIHSAADLRVDAPLAELRKTNVQGTAKLLELARLARREHRLERYAQVSTAYVAGARTGTILETSVSAGELAESPGFSCAYEQSKFEGECLVHAVRKELPVSIFRPGMIVGASDSGEIRTFNTFYYPLRLYLTGKLPILPVDPELPVNIVPVDYVAEAVVRLTFNPQAEGLTFHLTAPTASLPRAGELVEFVRGWARTQLGIRLPKPIFIRLPLPGRRYRPEPVSTRPASPTRGAGWQPLAELKGLITYLPYFNERKQFRRDNTDRLLGHYGLDWREFLPRLLAYAVDHSFLHRTERTVHEQILARLERKSRPITFFDIVDGSPVRHSAGEVRRDILRAARSLAALGIRPGDRVAIVGLNSTRYLVLDTAIGLCGAVSVPLYYTSPPEDIDHILQASGASLLFAGAPAIFKRLGELRTRLPVVSFWSRSLPEDLAREVVSWEAFLALGAEHPNFTPVPVEFNQLATLRYSSGTTGRPKGVSFRHRQLRWMAQSMAALLPWKARNRPANYLSFLPMNHVVEGILAAYSPYYLPAEINLYFLEDLKELQDVLPRLRPAVFFSVPRIYERIWEALESNPAGRRYLSLPPGLWKRALGALLRWRTLRKAGLDRCAQLITGSAPCSEALLRNFRELGIEIHNAYGMTEAPLVTLNRLGENRLGTVGAPLPQTEICVAADGEVLVRGPQVMAGYYSGSSGVEPAQPFRDGWLLTGDLGCLSPEGSLILKGRKKELFKTSYGKYIQPESVEARLREIPGVTEALLVGEVRPYCAALLWVQGEALEAGAGQRIDHRICQINRELAHPEQVKRWAVLKHDLSIQGGDLTANLKLKRGAVTSRLEQVVEALYREKSAAAILHRGNAGRG